MDGMHDLGGRQGFGPIRVSDDDPAFETEADARIYAISQTVAPDKGTIDWFRHTIELMPPRAYMTEPYFQKWLFVILIEQIQAGGFSVDGVLGAAQGAAPAKAPKAAKTPKAPPPVQSVGDVLKRVRGQYGSFERPARTPPRFEPGQRVRTLRHGHDGHIRLPAYARGATGDVLRHRGAHLLPDAGARGEKRPEHLYTVVFTAPELWGDAADARDTVTLDLWENYLVPA